MREEVEEIVTTEEYLNRTLQEEGKYSEVSNDKIEVSKVLKPKFSVTSYIVDPPVDRFRDALYCLDSPISSTASSPPGTSDFLSNDTRYNFCDDENQDKKSSNRPIKVPFPEFGVDLILASPTKCKLCMITLIYPNWLYITLIQFCTSFHKNFILFS